jgi:hypothetical protein
MDYQVALYLLQKQQIRIIDVISLIHVIMEHILDQMVQVVCVKMEQYGIQVQVHV